MEAGVWPIKAETGGTKRLSCPGAPQSPSWFQCGKFCFLQMEIPVDGNGSQKKDSDFLKGRRAQPSNV